MKIEPGTSAFERRLAANPELRRACEALAEEIRRVARQESEMASVDPLYNLPMIYPFTASEVGL